MKKLLTVAFPLLFALLTLALFLFLYRPGPASAGMTSACLVFLTALGWSALIVFGSRGMRGRRAAYPSFALLASILLAGPFRPFPVEPLSHWGMIGIEALGAVGIALYLRILGKKGEPPHE
jgi:hypothetical protein